MTSPRKRDLAAEKLAREFQGRTGYAGPDHSSRFGAAALAARIEQFWRDKGYPGAACVHDRVGFEQNDTDIIWGVRSNLVNGLPPRDALSAPKVERPFDETADAIGSYNEAMKAVGRRIKAGAPLPEFLQPLRLVQ